LDAYAQGNHAKAQTFILESAELFRELGDTHRLSRALNHQGFNSLALGQEAEVHTAFDGALRMACEGSWMPTTFQSPISFATIEAVQKAIYKTLELVIYISQHPFGMKETKNLARRLRVELESALSRRRKTFRF
jgi:hypothetical protein